MGRCLNCGRDSEYMDLCGWCDDCNYELQLQDMKYREEAADE